MLVRLRGLGNSVRVAMRAPSPTRLASLVYGFPVRAASRREGLAHQDRRTLHSQQRFQSLLGMLLFPNPEY